MADADRIAAALLYQQQLDDALTAPVTANPKLLTQGVKARANMTPPVSVMAPGHDEWRRNMDDAEKFMLATDVASNLIPFAGPAAKGAIAVGKSMGKYAGPEIAKGLENYMVNSGLRPSIFIGENANNWNATAATKALEMEKAGIDPKIIWQETGTWKGPEGKLRQEISDLPSKITETVHNDIMSKHYFNDPMNKALTHEQLYQNYPDLGKINTTVTAWPNPKGSYSELRNEIEASGPSSMAQRSTALHELQHVIQRKEGFAKGGSPEMFKPHDVFSTKALEDAAILDKTMKANKFGQLEAKERFKKLFNREPEPSAFAALERVGTGKELDAARDAARLSNDPIKAYRRLAGEVEARVTQSRRNLTPEQRRASYPGDAFEDVAGLPINQLIIRQ